MMLLQFLKLQMVYKKIPPLTLALLYIATILSDGAHIMVDRIELSQEQKLQQDKINAYVEDLQRQIAGDAEGVDLGDVIESAFSESFGIDIDPATGNFNNATIADIAGTLSNIASNENIAKIKILTLI